MNDRDYERASEGIQEDVLSSLYFLEPNGQELDDASSLYAEINSNKNRYKYITPLGQGGMKSVDKVLDCKLGIHVAMATPREDLSQDIYEVFLEEARLTSKLKHPNIITTHDIGINDDGVPFFTMDLKLGTSLSVLLKKNKELSEKGEVEELEIEDRLTIFLKICDAIAYAHSKGVLHLDLKPANIQIGEFGEVLVCDWGIGKVLNLEAEIKESDNTMFEDETEDEDLLNSDYLNKITLRGKISGTPGYISPEQINATDKTYQTDVYGLGCLLYTLTTGSSAFTGSVKERIDKARIGDFESPKQRFPNKGISESLNAVIMKAMCLRPEERYADAQALRNDIQKVINFHPTDAEITSVFNHLKLLYKRKTTACNVFLLSLAIIVVLTFSFISAINDEKTISLNNQLKAEEALVLLEEQSDFTNNLESAYEIEINKKIYSYYLTGRFDLLKSLFNQVLEVNPNNKTFIKQKYLSLIVQHQFKEAIAYSKSFPDKDYFRYNDLCEKFSEIKGDKRYLDPKQMVLFFNQIPLKETKLMERVFLHEKVLKRKEGERYYVALNLLKRINPKWKHNKNNVVNFKTKTYTFTGNGLIHFQVNNASVLRLLEVRHLNLKNSSVYSLSMFHADRKNLISLNISNTLVTNLKGLRKFSRLKILKISKDQFTQGQLRSVPIWVDIVND